MYWAGSGLSHKASLTNCERARPLRLRCDGITVVKIYTKMRFYLYPLLIALLICLSRASNDEDDFDDTLNGEEEFEDDVKSDTSAPPREKMVYSPPTLKDSVHFSEYFESVSDFRKKWVVSNSKKDGLEISIAKYDGIWEVEEPATSSLKGDLGLILKSKAKHHAISSHLKKPFEFVDQPLIVQYEVKFQDGQECGGAYVKLLTKSNDLDLDQFNDKTPYTIMFGPDKCGNDHKLHFIFRHKNPITGEFEEKHAKKPSASLDNYFSDKKTHLYTLVVKPDNTYQIYVDQSRVSYGNLLEDFTPPVNPPKEITDPDDKKPDDWDDRERIKDPEAVKPEDWDESEPEFVDDVNAAKPDGWLDDEPELIPDPSAEKPSDWDEDMDGEWEAPLISNPKCENAPGCGEWKIPSVKNPKYKGKWEVPLIDNPDYKGKWSPRTIPNPKYFEDKEPFKMTSIAAVGLELWSMSNDIVFDNFIITTSQSTADDWTAQTWSVKHTEESNDSASSIVQSVLDATQERPWLWAVIIVVIVLPVVLIVAYCCFSSPKAGARPEHPKKTDVSSPDDEEEEEEDASSEGGVVEDIPETAGDDPTSGLGSYESGEKKVKKRTKADLEAKTE